ncbi:MAG: S8 family serine peptidase [bacterium]|nr:S8 family serine peptidase [bacterium]
MRLHHILYGALCTVFITSYSFSQEVTDKQKNWYNGSGLGMNTDKAYKKLLDGKSTKTVVVAVIDSGVDVDHEDLKGQIWINEDEIPNNGVDDDNNGYIDDVHGWNFLGNAEGENIHNVRLEVTRIYSQLHKKYEGVSKSEVSADDMEEFTLYLKVKEEVMAERDEAKSVKGDLSQTYVYLAELDKMIKKELGDNYSLKQIKKARKDDKIGEAAEVMYLLMQEGVRVEDLKDYLDYCDEVLDYNYNPDIDPRAQILGDDVSNFTSGYGNNDYEGPDAGHGTHCAGIIGAVRGNGIGNDGVAGDVAIMSLRAVPNGDEWDKDIAMAVRYAVDNGAQVINMSFGKSYSPEQAQMIEAFRYAEKNGVLVVHAAGNEASDNNISENYPRPKYAAMDQSFTNWIEVGASTRHKKAKIKDGFIVRDGIAADFSNYGNNTVDVFAPGHDIYSTVPDNEYDLYDGTSMAGPMVAGTAALIKSYYPELTMFEVRDIILQSVEKTNKTMPLPGDTEKMVSLNQLSKTGGIVNVYNAVELAESYSTKMK